MIASRGIEKLNDELMKLLSARDERALDIIDELKRMGSEQNDDRLLGYAYYRYAYFYYFTKQDLQRFRVYLQQAIRYLLKGEDKEFLAGAYNLVAYDAQDQGSFDMAYAYSKGALMILEGENKHALAGLIESSTGRMLAEIENYEEGLKYMLRAVAKLEKVTHMHVYNYNMIVSYADIGLVSFLLRDVERVKSVADKVEEYYMKASEEEVALSYSYRMLPKIYYAMLIDDDAEMDSLVSELLSFWRKHDAAEMVGLITEIEALFSYMIGHDYITQAKEMLEATACLEDIENAAVTIRYCALEIAYYEKVHDMRKLRESLRAQHEARKRQKAEVARMTKYSMEFADMAEALAREREERARTEQDDAL